jgi:hypothetical protein
MSKESEKYRLDMLRHLGREYGETPPAKIAEAEKVIADYRKGKAHAEAIRARLPLPLPEPNLCPACFYEHDNRSPLIAVAAPDPTKLDRMICRTCGYLEDRDVRQ